MNRVMNECFSVVYCLLYCSTEMVLKVPGKILFLSCPTIAIAVTLSFQCQSKVRIGIVGKQLFQHSLVATGPRRTGIGSSRSHITFVSPHFQTPAITGPHGVLDGRIESTIFQFVNSRRRGTVGTGNIVLQNSRMFACFHGVQGTSQQGVVDEFGSLLSRKSHVNASINHVFHEVKDIRRTGSRNSSGHVNLSFVINVHLS